MKKLLLSSIFLAFFLVTNTSYSSRYEACSGDSDCDICTDCSRCKYCSKEGGSCGVCEYNKILANI